MSNVPQPAIDSVRFVSAGVPRGLEPGFYLDEDVALLVDDRQVAIVAPTVNQAKLIAANLSRTSMTWGAYRVAQDDLVNCNHDYAAWLKLAAKSDIRGELENESREPNKAAASASLARS